jgi:Cu(I)/Ag(I) efflux system membrane fusion protein
MNGHAARWIILSVGVAVIAAAAGYFLARHEHAPAAPERRVLYWYDPMHPEQHFDAPGQSPFMNMPLAPRYADAAVSGAAVGGEAPAVRIDPGVVQNLGVRYTTVERAPWSQGLDAVGTIVFDQRRIVVLQARAAGFVTGVHGRAPGDVLARGAPLVDLLVPDWAAAQAELLAVLEGGDRALIEAARTRLTLLGMPEELIARAEATRRLQTTVTIRAPIAGAIESLDAREGMAVSAGATLARLNGTETIWLEAAVPEAQAALATIGASAEVRLPGFPAETFRGRVLAVLPEANAETRTLRLRIELANRDGRLRAGMFGEAHLDAGRPQMLLQVASEAVIRTGTRNVVLVAGADGRYVPTEVRLGAEADGRTVVLEGLEAGQRVVASGQFLIDSDANLEGVLGRLQAGAAPLHSAAGRVESLSPDGIMIAHDAIPSLGWPAMTMSFRLARPELAARLRPGDTVSFRFRQIGDDYVIEELRSSGGAR